MPRSPSMPATEHAVGIAYKKLPSDVFVGDVLLLNDGQISLQVLAIDGPRIKTRVLVGGELGNNKGINRQGGGLSAGALTDKDREDIRDRGVAQGRLSGGLLCARCRRHERGACAAARGRRPRPADGQDRTRRGDQEPGRSGAGRAMP